MRLEIVRIKQMRHTQPKLMACLLMAMLIFFGTSGQALASLLCKTETCPKKAAELQQARKSCCPTAAQDPSENQSDGCCCEIESAPDFSKPTEKLANPSPIGDVAIPEVGPSSIEADLVSAHSEIPAFADLSPPNVPLARDRGRAPPVA